MDWADRAQRLARAPSKRLLSEVWTGSRTKSGEWCQRCQHLWIDFSSHGRSWKYCYDAVSYIFIFTFLSQQSGAWNLALWSWSRVSEFIAWSRERLGAAQAADTSPVDLGVFFHLSKSKMFDSIEYWGIWWRSEINFKTLPRWTLLEPVICILCSQSVIQNGRRCGIRRDFSICPTSQALGDVCNLGKAPRHPFWETPKMRTRQWRSRTSLCHQLRRHGNSQGSSRILRDWTNCFSIIHWSNPWSNPQRHRISQHSNINKRTPSFGGWQLR